MSSDETGRINDANGTYWVSTNSINCTVPSHLGKSGQLSLLLKNTAAYTRERERVCVCDQCVCVCVSASFDKVWQMSKPVERQLNSPK